MQKDAEVAWRIQPGLFSRAVGLAATSERRHISTCMRAVPSCLNFSCLLLRLHQVFLPLGELTSNLLLPNLNTKEGAFTNHHYDPSDLLISPMIDWHVRSTPWLLFDLSTAISLLTFQAGADIPTALSFFLRSPRVLEGTGMVEPW